MIDRNHVDGVVDIGDESELDASLDHPPDKIVGVCNFEMSLRTNSLNPKIEQVYSPAVRESPTT